MKIGDLYLFHVSLVGISAILSNTQLTEIVMELSRFNQDLTNLKFGSLTALKPTHKDNSNNVFWDFLCDCGKTHNARGNTVKYQSKKGITKVPSCGCVELAGKTKHGFRTVKNTHPAYQAYRRMMSCCYDKNSYGYRWYGAVDVTISDEWKDKPEVFVKWAIENGWQKGLHIDKDILCKEKGIFPHVYSPDTCQWVTAKVNVGFATNRDNYGKHPNVKLSHDEVAEIERLYFSGEITNQSELARLFNLQSSSSISRLIIEAKTRLGVTP